jgi:NDP-sugar pyrophosphorylase family protein
MGIGLVVPAAGLGTRLAPLTDRTPKELLPLGGRPVVAAALLEAEAARIRDVVFVLGPHKEALREWLDANRPKGANVAFATQPTPLGVQDAVARGRALLGPGSFAVLYPDWIALPDQSALARLVAAEGDVGGSVIGLVRRTPLLGPTARATATSLDRVRRIESLDRGLGDVHTGFAEIRGEGMRLPVSDDENLDAWNEVARAGALHGVLVDDVLDVGTLAGYEDAVQRFSDGRAAWR